jgi:pyruvate dehydrogenase E1 component beta subunit
VTRNLKFQQAILEATDQCMARDPRVYVIGLGVTDPKGTFGTTLGLEAKYGGKRIMDMPTSENAMTGVAIGSALVGMRPIMTHQRMDFALLALDQIINNAAKWHYMFGGRMRVPLLIRLMIGRGWGQGPQHSQSLQALFGHIPGLKVVMPTTPHDAKGLLIAGVEDDNPVIYIEHRWLHGIFGPVPEEMYRVPIGRARTVREGRDVTIVATSYMTLESLRAAELLDRFGIDTEVVDVRTIKPLDSAYILASVCKTGRLVVADAAWRTFGFAAEVLALAAEEAHANLKAAPRRITFPDAPTPSTPALANQYYPRAVQIVNAVRAMFGLPDQSEEELGIQHTKPLDVPDEAFTGPF